jgi:hypothetical protein
MASMAAFSEERTPSRPFGCWDLVVIVEAKGSCGGCYDMRVVWTGLIKVPNYLNIAFLVRGNPFGEGVAFVAAAVVRDASDRLIRITKITPMRPLRRL